MNVSTNDMKQQCVSKPDEKHHECSVCSCEFDIEAEGGIAGYFGILPVSFCPTCYSCMCDMVDQATCKEWVGLTDAEIEEFDYYARDLVMDIEKALKERNNVA